MRSHQRVWSHSWGKILENLMEIIFIYFLTYLNKLFIGSSLRFAISIANSNKFCHKMQGTTTNTTKWRINSNRCNVHTSPNQEPDAIFMD